MRPRSGVQGLSPWLSEEQRPDVLFGQALELRLACQYHAVENGAFAFGEIGDLFFNGTLCNQADHVHIPGLADAVRTVGGLILGGGVPPWIIMDDKIRAGQVEAGTARLEGNQEYLALSAVEAVAELLTLFRLGLAVEVEALHAFAAKALADHLQHTHEL